MTDIIKTSYNPNSGSLMKAIKKDPSIISKNEKLLEREMKWLSRISGSKDFQIICIGNESYKILNQMTKSNVYKIWHYSAYQLNREQTKERIRKDLREIINTKA